METQTQAPKKVIRLFKNTLGPSKYIFASGKVANFINGRYATDVESEIAELDKEIALRHPNIYVDKNEDIVDMDALDPIAALRKKFYAEGKAAALAELARANDSSRDIGASVQAPLNPTSSRDIAAVTIGAAGKK